MENKTIGPFLVVKKLGAHRRHNVYLARQTEQNREVALKFIKLPPSVDREKALAKINHEVQVVKRLEHRNLVRLLGAGTFEDQVFFAHELVEGEALSSLLSRRGRLAPDSVVDYGTQVARALEYLHQNEIIHSKLTADKILIDSEGKVKIADLRLNRSRKRRWDAARRATLEVAAYMAPEQLLEDGATAKSDLYSLGVLLYEMLTGRLPFEPQTMAQLAREKQSGKPRRVTETVMNCPGWLDKLVARLIHADPKSRPHSARAVVMTLEQIRAVDQSKKSAAVEMTRGFSPLTAGTDKAEARRALGQKPVKIQKEAGPLLQSLPFLISGLVMIAAIVALIVFWPFSPSRRDLMADANRLLNSTSHTDWQEARRLYEKVMRSSDEELATEAEKNYFLARRKSMLHRLDGGVSGFDKPEVREFNRGYQMQRENRPEDALAFYQQFTTNYDFENRRVYVYDEAADRLKKLVADNQQAAQVREELEKSFEQADELVKSPETSQEAREIWDRFVDEYGENEFLHNLLVRARQGLSLLPDQPSPDVDQELSGTESDDDPKETMEEDKGQEQDKGQEDEKDQDIP